MNLHDDRAGRLILSLRQQGVTDPRVLAALRVSFATALAAAAFNAVAGTLVAWVFVRYDFPGKRLFDAIVDLPFALPTAVAGIALTQLYGPTGWIGRVGGGIGSGHGVQR